MFDRLMVLVCIVMLFSLAGGALAQDIDLTPPEQGDFDPASVEDITVGDYPILPEVTDHTRQIYERALESGRNPAVFSKIGDCMTASAYFMAPYGLDNYDLGEYGDLQGVVDYFGGDPVLEEYDTFANPGLATESGFNTASIIDPIWANPTYCESNESPLSCEYRVANGAFSIIMVGTNDVFFFEASDFDYYLRQIVLETINSDMVPILNTFPTRPEDPAKTDLFNRVVIKIAEDYDLPLINLWAAVDPLPDNGVDPAEPIHLSIPPDEQTGDFVNNLDYGYTMRNLITLQTLDILLNDLIQPE